MLPRKASYRAEDRVTVPQTNSGGRGENPKALERTLVKELGKMTPKLRDKVCLCWSSIYCKADVGRRETAVATVY